MARAHAPVAKDADTATMMIEEMEVRAVPFRTGS